MKLQWAVAILIISAISIGFLAPPVSAQNQPHYTLFINQTRGDECCDKGSVTAFEKQLALFSEHDLVAHYALRWDVITNSSHLDLTSQYTDQQFGALLEVTPSLAEAAGVTYTGSDTTWYEARHVFLVGYAIEDRQRLIDTYFQKFHQEFGYYPKFATSWMIDPWSLNYLKTKYGVVLHQITREQFGTDSYTLYGGPVHYPYYPSANWALVPGSDRSLPLIVRQTITDPVYNYGDRSNAYTSQPNDYMLRQADFNYFQHLFNQTHNQDNDYTFALLGLENSMPEPVFEEYRRQVEYVAEWQKQGTGVVASIDQVLAAADQQPLTTFTLYGGSAATDANEKAWWIQNHNYRLRLRLSNGELIITDVRVYDSDFADPYLDNQAESSGWWIVPYVLDGSRHYAEGSELTVSNDGLVERHPLLGSPHRMSLGRFETVSVELSSDQKQVAVKGDGQELLKLTEQNLVVTDELNESASFSGAVSQLTFRDEMAQPVWGFATSDKKTFTLLPSGSDLTKLRQSHKQLLFPAVTYGLADSNTTSLLVNNRYAVAGRNPVRLVLFPRDQDGHGVQLANLPEVTVDTSSAKVTMYEPHSSNGMVFIDIDSQEPLSAGVVIKTGDMEMQEHVYFAQNCKTNAWYCVTHPRAAIWYVRSFIADKKRQQDEKLQQELRIAE